MQSWLAKIGGDTWSSRRCLSVWPWPSVTIGDPSACFKGRDYRAFTKALLPGDMILTKSNKYFLSNRAIAKTAFKHLAVYTGKQSGIKRTVTHAISEGVVCEDLYDFMTHVDVACVVQPWVSEKQADVIVDTALNCIGRPYDFYFDATEKSKIYCTELGLHCVKKAGIVQPEPIYLNTRMIGYVLPFLKSKTPVMVADSFLVYPVKVFSESARDKRFWKSSYKADLLGDLVRVFDRK